MTLTKTGVKERGWTDSLIRQFLGEPDSTKVNFYYKSGPPVCLYLVSRVEAAEMTPEFVAAREKVEKRQTSAAVAVKTKRNHLQALVDKITITVPKMDHNKLIRLACESYNERNWERDCYASDNSDPAFLDRMCVNYLRHNMTHYENLLDVTAGKVGAGDAYCEIKGKVLDAIATAYPYLASECIRQHIRMYEAA